MLSVVIETCNHEDALARTLSCLVAAAVEGVVREVIVRDAGSTDRTGAVADHAGCRYLASADQAQAYAVAKGDWLLLLEPGARLAEGWMEPVLHHLATSGNAACFRIERPSGFAMIAGLLRRRAPIARGLLITRLEARRLADGKGGAAELARAVSPTRLGAFIQPPLA